MKFVNEGDPNMEKELNDKELDGVAGGFGYGTPSCPYNYPTKCGVLDVTDCHTRGCDVFGCDKFSCDSDMGVCGNWAGLKGGCDVFDCGKVFCGQLLSDAAPKNW